MGKAESEKLKPEEERNVRPAPPEPQKWGVEACKRANARRYWVFCTFSKRAEHASKRAGRSEKLTQRTPSPQRMGNGKHPPQRTYRTQKETEGDREIRQIARKRQSWNRKWELRCEQAARNQSDEAVGTYRTLPYPSVGFCTLPELGAPEAASPVEVAACIFLTTQR
jgi:hypothetical protein